MIPRRVHAVCTRCGWQRTFPSPAREKDFEFAVTWHGKEKPEAIHNFSGKITPFGGKDEQTTKATPLN